MDGISGIRLLRLPLRFRGIHLGRSVDVILDRTRSRALGFEVECGDDERRFLPFSVAEIRERELEVKSPLVLLEEAELRFYTERGSTLAALLGRGVARNGRPLGVLADLELTRAGEIVAAIVSADAGTARVAYGDDVTLGGSTGSVRAAS